MAETINTAITELFGIKYPIILAGMNIAAGPELAAAVTNAGGLGVIGGVGYTPQKLKEQLDELKAGLSRPDAPFGVDLLLPKVGEGARKTNKDYTKGQLDPLIDIIIQQGAKLFVSAVGVPPVWAVDKLHDAGIVCMSMIGSPKHVEKVLAAGVDLICAQGTEGGGHTGEIAISVLIPQCVDLCKGRISPLTKKPVLVVAAGGIFDGRGLSMALCLGAEAVWVGTRFVATHEAGAPNRHKEGVLQCTAHDTIRSTIYTGRPLRILKNPYVVDAEDHHSDEIRKWADEGVIWVQGDLDRRETEGKDLTPEEMVKYMQPLLMGQSAAAVKELLPAAEVIKQMMHGAIELLRHKNGLICRL